MLLLPVDHFLFEQIVYLIELMELVYHLIFWRSLVVSVGMQVRYQSNTQHCNS